MEGDEPYSFASRPSRNSCRRDPFGKLIDSAIRARGSTENLISCEGRGPVNGSGRRRAHGRVEW